MQRLAYLAGSSTRFVRVVAANHLKNDRALFEQSTKLYNANNIIFQRCLATKSKDTKNTAETDPHNDLYKPSTAKQGTHIPDDLKHHHQATDTITSTVNATSISGGKVWSAQNPDNVHIAPLGRVTATTFVPKSGENGQQNHETTVYTTQGELNIVDPFKTHTLQPEPTSAKLAEAAAASAFETFAPDAPLTPVQGAEAVFAPKISSTDIYSTTSSPTADFETNAPAPSNEPPKYETAAKGKVFGGQNTSADTKKHPNEDPFQSGEKDKPSNDTKEIPVQRERNIREEILCESLKYVHDKGWSMEAIRTGIRACNEPATTESLFYNGYDLVEYFMRDANTKMVAYMNELADKENLQGTALLLDGLKYRLKLVIPYANTWEQALAQKGLPPNAKRAWKSLLDLANDAWFSIGDTSTDIKWYTKRLSIATIYRSAEIYMLKDQSPNKIETMNFLERHLSDYHTTGSVRSSVSQSLSDTAQVASGLLTVMRTMTTRR